MKNVKLSAHNSHVGFTHKCSLCLRENSIYEKMTDKLFYIPLKATICKLWKSKMPFHGDVLGSETVNLSVKCIKRDWIQYWASLREKEIVCDTYVFLFRTTLTLRTGQFSFNTSQQDEAHSKVFVSLVISCCFLLLLRGVFLPSITVLSFTNLLKCCSVFISSSFFAHPEKSLNL